MDHSVSICPYKRHGVRISRPKVDCPIETPVLVNLKLLYMDRCIKACVNQPNKLSKLCHILLLKEFRHKSAALFIEVLFGDKRIIVARKVKSLPVLITISLQCHRIIPEFLKVVSHPVRSSDEHCPAICLYKHRA